MFTWKGLRDELTASAWLDVSDDLTTQRGLIATAEAIVERMSDETRHVSWRPVRLATASVKEGRGRDLPGSGDGGAIVEKPSVAPRAPSPAPAYAEITF